MSIEAVAVLQTITRDEFERDWGGFEEPYSFIEGQPWFDGGADPVTEIVVEIAGQSYILPAHDVVTTIKESEEYYRYEVENEEEDDDWHFVDDDEIEEKVRDKVHEHWFDLLDSGDEALAVFEYRCDYMLKGFQELVAYCNMLGERAPELRPHLVEVLLTASNEVTKAVQKWVDDHLGDED